MKPPGEAMRRSLLALLVLIQLFVFSGCDTPLDSDVDTHDLVETPDLCEAVADHPDWELCDSGQNYCAVVFTDSTGCQNLCDQLGLACYAT